MRNTFDKRINRGRGPCNTFALGHSGHAADGPDQGASVDAVLRPRHGAQVRSTELETAYHELLGWKELRILHMFFTCSYMGLYAVVLEQPSTYTVMCPGK